MRRTKILATIGPVSESPSRLARMVAAGADAFRLNCSHGSDAEHRAMLRAIRATFRRVRREGAILADVQGPKIRLGEIAGSPITLKDNARWILDDRSEPGGTARAPVEVPHLRRAARQGDPILIGDGAVELRVDDVGSHRITTTVVHGGSVGSRAGIYFPNAHLSTSVLSRKDRHDIGVVVSEGIDFLGLSFVRDASDIEEARRELARHPGGEDVGIVAKIERAEALESLDAILKQADGVMVARGDLGIEVPLERLALEQKRILRAARTRGRFGIVATQMLLSMVHSPRPTRAESTDVANAVLDGADAVMLSEESAMGEYPVESVAWLDRICGATETALEAGSPDSGDGESVPTALEESIAGAAVELSARLRAAAIVTPTHSGRTARLVAGWRPTCRVLALSAVPATRRKLALVWGVETESVPSRGNLDRIAEWGRRAARRHWVGPGPLVLTAGYPVEGRPTNLLTVVEGTPPRYGRRSRWAPPEVGASTRPLRS